MRIESGMGIGFIENSITDRGQGKGPDVGFIGP